MANVNELPKINEVNKKEPKKVKVMQFGEGNYIYKVFKMVRLKEFLRLLSVFKMH